jgi:hypothetical protein
MLFVNPLPLVYNAYCKDAGYVDLRLKLLAKKLICSIRKTYDKGERIRLYDLFTYMERRDGAYRFRSNAKGTAHPLECMIENYPTTIFQSYSSALNFAVGAPWYPNIRDAFAGVEYNNHNRKDPPEIVYAISANHVAYDVYAKLTRREARAGKKYRSFIDAEWDRVIGSRSVEARIIF